MERAKDSVLICAILPYFLERDSLWYEKHFDKIVSAIKTNSFFSQNVLYLKEGQAQILSELVKKLDEFHYERVWRVENMGEFSHQGSIIEIFPINMDRKIKIEFLGNQIDSIFYAREREDENFQKNLLKKKLQYQKKFWGLGALKKGDFLVHIDHGIGRFVGKIKMELGGKEIDYYVLEFAHGDRLYLPKRLGGKLSVYAGFTKPRLSRLGGVGWLKRKYSIKKEAEAFAKELVKIYSERAMATRAPYITDGELERYLEATFPFQETKDQLIALEEIKKDLESNVPMDRVLCGDVGFGKTEVALRTAVKVVNAGFQVVVLVPTTILAYQHYQTFKERTSNLPVHIELLTRFTSKKREKEIIKKAMEGKIDILIGTHKVLSEHLKDWVLKRVGLLIIDDEHKFGVAAKERLKKIRPTIDVLSLSATPIPRTLYMALSSLKSISILKTPPPGRLPIKMFVLPFSEEIIKRAIEKELKRGGQVYYLHNRVETIKSAKEFLEGLFPKRKIGIAHGRMKDYNLFQIMDAFRAKQFDILIATTIIEAGLDLPNVNTLLVADATKLGLAQAYQIKGRIGRHSVKAFAYFLYPSKLTPMAKKRLRILKKMGELGSGYKIALKDLEIRGAGNILGKEQSGMVNMVGLNLYCQILAETIEKTKYHHP